VVEDRGRYNTKRGGFTSASASQGSARFDEPRLRLPSGRCLMNRRPPCILPPA
jgi:hypothetical protein